VNGQTAVRIDARTDLSALAGTQTPAAVLPPAAAGQTLPSGRGHQAGEDARGEGATRAYTIEIPPRTVLLNANDRPDHFRRARIVKNLRTVAHQLAVIRRIPHLERVEITGFVHPPDGRRRDPHNWYPTLKASIDGIVDSGVILDDSSEIVVRTDMQLGDRARYLSFSLLIQEVAP
jgi:hypothetical protein